MLSLLERFRLVLAVTLGLVVLEGITLVFFPLIIGRAISGVLAGHWWGLLELGGLGILALVVGAVRRVYDSRAYAGIYEVLAVELAGPGDDRPDRTKMAHLGLLTEVVEFMENSMPAILSAVLGLLGTALMLAWLNLWIFLACVLVGAVISGVYLLTSGITTRLNKGHNDAFESRMDAVQSGQVGVHARQMAKWNVRLSDLETGNFSVSWLLMMGLLVFAVAIAATGATDYGAVFALVMYVFQFVESMIELPFRYQEWLRLREIVDRLFRPGTGPDGPEVELADLA